MLAMGNHVVTGQRILFLGTTFSDQTSVSLLTINNKQTIAMTGSIAYQKELAEAPII